METICTPKTVVISGRSASHAVSTASQEIPWMMDSVTTMRILNRAVKTVATKSLSSSNPTSPQESMR